MHKVELGLLLVSTLTALFISACQGPTGPNGEDAFLTDSLPPVIEWISPASGIVISDTLLLRARVTDDRQLWRMVFYIAGFEQEGVLVDTTDDIYEYVWLASLYPPGPYPVMGRAWDLSRNMSSSPVILLEIKSPEE